MDKNSIHEKLLSEALENLKKKISDKFFVIVLDFLAHYRGALQEEFDEAIPHLLLYLQLIEPQFSAPFVFEPYHRKVKHPIDYYRFALDFIRPLIDLPNSEVFGLPHFENASQLLKKGENIVLLANHQTEPDPQVISILLEKTHSAIAEKIIYVAGERVITDPLAIPFSMGCDLLCIYSKRYIDHPPELKAEKQLHNKRTMHEMSALLQEGGKIIYVAPSGGRDRKNSIGKIEVAPFDPASIEMFYLMAKKANHPTHFMPFALHTYELFPPPESIQRELGEARFVRKAPTFLSFAPFFEMETFPGSEEKDKLKRRENRAREIWAIVNKMHNTMVNRCSKRS
ncbi:MAG: glycerol-3-phosphate acyltransferase [Chlamydiae bacterium]|nr:glycerol-3-phosphate acyltransferase [Chlamydiota bacterium]